MNGRTNERRRATRSRRVGRDVSEREKYLTKVSHARDELVDLCAPARRDGIVRVMPDGSFNHWFNIGVNLKANRTYTAACAWFDFEGVYSFAAFRYWSNFGWRLQQRWQLDLQRQQRRQWQQQQQQLQRQRREEATLRVTAAAAVDPQYGCCCMFRH